ncbi:MAG: outer membrane beta-barrel protein [Tangfeifania sp.]
MNRKKTMKTLKASALSALLATVVLCINISAWSQTTDTIVPAEQNPRTILRKIDIRKMGFNFWKDNFEGHWTGIDFGFNGFENPEYTGYNLEFMKNDLLRSNSTYINILQHSIGLQRNRNTIGLVTGAGLHLQSYRLDNNTTIRKSENGRIEPEILYFDQNQKSKLSIVSLMVPLLAEFQVPVNHYENRIYFSGGVFGSVRLSSHTKIKYRADGKKEKLKVPGHYSLQDFKYGLMVRAGYRWINVFATYDLVPLFKNDLGPELTPFTFGITLLQF